MNKRKNRIILPLLGLLLLIIGAAAAGYPLVRSQILEFQARGEISDYEKAVKNESPEQIGGMLEQAKQYNEALQRGDAVSSAAYDDLLAVTDAIGYLEIPKLGIYLPIYHGLEDEVLQKGIGHIPKTSLPVGGPSTHCVLSGHSGLPAARILTELDRLDEGDRFYLHVLDQTLAYEVDQISVVLPDDTSMIQIEEGKDYVTLLTCTPYGINTHRLLVRGERTEYIRENQAIAVHSQKPDDKAERAELSWQLVLWGISLGAGVFLLIVGVWLLISGAGKRKSSKKESRKKKEEE